MPRPLLARLRRWFTSPAQPIRRYQPRLEMLEDRLTPAFTLGITNVATANVTPTDNAGVRTFTATNTLANLNIADIKAALVAGLDVVVTTGTGGAEPGNINWSASGSLDVEGIGIGNASRTLSLVADPSGGTASIVITADISDSATGDGEFLNVVLDAVGNVVMTGTTWTGIQDITIDAGVNAANLGSITSQGNQTVTAAGIVVQGGSHFSAGDQTYNGNVLLPGNRTITATAGNVTFNGLIDGTSNDVLTINAAGTVHLGGQIGSTSEIADLDIIATSINLQANITLTDVAVRSMSFDGDVTTPGGLVFTLATAAGSSVLFQNGDVTLGGNLTITLPAATDVVTIENGIFNAQSHTVTITGVLEIADGAGIEPATYAGSGTLSAAEVVVQVLGRLAPGGNGGLGNLPVTGNVTFNAGAILDIDLAGAADQLNVTGSVSITAGRLDGDGALSSPGPFPILTATGAIAGTFNFPSVPFVLGEDVVTTTYLPNSVTITQVAADPNTVTGVAEDGSLFTIKKTGPGELVVVNQPLGGLEGIVVRNSTTSTKLTITVTPNGASGLLDVNALRVEGSIGSIIATTTNLLGDHRVSGFLKTLKIRNLTGSLSGGGTVGQLTSITGRIFNGDITLTSKLNALTVNEYQVGAFFSEIRAPRIGTLKTVAIGVAGLDGRFEADLTLDAGSSTTTALSKATIAGRVMGTWDIHGKVGTVIVKDNAVANWLLGTTGFGFEHADQLGAITKVAISTGMGASSGIHTIGRLGTLTMGNANGIIVTAASIGTLKAIRNNSLGMAGNFTGDVTVTGFVNPGRVALKTFSASGSVTNSRFNILDGNVTSFTAGKFINSQLYVGLSPFGSLLNGTFTGDFKISTFKTTAVPLVPGTPDPATDAFQDSEVCASRFGTVRLSAVTVSNGGTVFGLRVAAVGNQGSTRVATSPFPVNTNLVPPQTFTDFQFVALA